MSDEERFRRALQKIRDYRIDGPVDEWAEAAAFSAVCELAADALEPGVITNRVAQERETERRDRERAKQLRRESSAGKRHFYASGGLINGQQSGAWVCVLNDKHERPDVVYVKTVEVVGDPISTLLAPGIVTTINVWSLKDPR